MDVYTLERIENLFVSMAFLAKSQLESRKTALLPSKCSQMVKTISAVVDNRKEVLTMTEYIENPPLRR